ncbi:MAG TPA: hypothetical protein VGD18_04295 [Thiobacillaceae bacterium]
MIVVRLLLVALAVVVAALALAWLLSGDRKHLVRLVGLVRFALVVALVAAMAYVVERLVLR